MYLFEEPILELEKQIISLKESQSLNDLQLSQEIHALVKKLNLLIKKIYSKLTPWEKVQLSRHPSRPYTQDYIQILFPDFKEMHGDHCFGDDPSVIGGIATCPFNISLKQKIPMLILGHQKGRTVQEKIKCNFGMARPEGYRKAMRLMKLAERFKMPILIFIDTPGAYPGIEAEERGQAQAIAESIQLMMSLQVPMMSVVIGEGGSGGALAIGITDKILMQEYSTYSVISPESCASILWHDSHLAPQASEKLKMNPPELLSLKIIDDIISEPLGGAHRHWERAAEILKEKLEFHFNPLIQIFKTSPKNLVQNRISKFRKIGKNTFLEKNAKK